VIRQLEDAAGEAAALQLWPTILLPSPTTHRYRGAAGIRLPVRVEQEAAAMDAAAERRQRFRRPSDR